MATERTVTQLLELVKTCGSVESVNEWNGRYYINIWDASRTFRGDQTAKWFIDSRGVVNHDPGKGTKSDGFRDSVEILNAFFASNDIDVRKMI